MGTCSTLTGRKTVNRWVAWWPAFVILVEEWPGSKEGVALGPFIIVEADSHRLDCMILHEKVHVVQQEAIFVVGMDVGLLLGVWWWVGGAIGLALYAGAWFLTDWGETTLEGQADRYQEDCQER